MINFFYINKLYCLEWAQVVNMGFIGFFLPGGFILLPTLHIPPKNLHKA